MLNDMKKKYIYPEVDVCIIQPRLNVLFASGDTPEPGLAPSRGQIAILYV